jgi:hypothetical protein
MRGLEVLVRSGVLTEVVMSGRERPHEPAHQRHDVRLVDRARDPDLVTRRATARSQNRANRSTIAGSVQPPSATAQRGVVKWWKVTTGTRPRSRVAAHIRR